MKNLAFYFLLLLTIGAYSQSKTQSPNKLLIEKYIDGFRESDHQKILSCLTDDIVWELPGNVILKGKIAFDGEIENENFIGKPNLQIIRMVEENNIVVAEGTVKSTLKDGKPFEAIFCDVFHIKNGKIKQLTTYLMVK